MILIKQLIVLSKDRKGRKMDLTKEQRRTAVEFILNKAFQYYRDGIDIEIVTGNMEMDAIGAAVIGGADLMGGYASILGAFLGSFLIGILRNGLVLMGVGAYWNNFVTGAVILVAVAVSAFLRLKRK